MKRQYILLGVLLLIIIFCSAWRMHDKDHITTLADLDSFVMEDASDSNDTKYTTMADFATYMDLTFMLESEWTAASTTAQGKAALATDAETVTGTNATIVVTPAGLTAKMAAPGAIGETTPNTIRSKFKQINKSSCNVTLTAAECSDTLITNWGWNATADQIFIMPASVAGLKVRFKNCVTDATADIYWDTPGSTTQFILEVTPCGDGERVWTENATIYEEISFYTMSTNASSVAYDWPCCSIQGVHLDKGS